MNCLPCARVGLSASQMLSHTGSPAHAKRMGERNPTSPGYCVQCTWDCGAWSNLQVHLGGADHRKVVELLGKNREVCFKVPQPPAPKRPCLERPFERPCYESTRVGLLNETFIVERPRFPEVIEVEESMLEEPPLVIVLEDTIAPQIQDTVILIEDSVIEAPPRFPRIRDYNVDLDASDESIDPQVEDTVVLIEDTVVEEAPVQVPFRLIRNYDLNLSE